MKTRCLLGGILLILPGISLAANFIHFGDLHFNPFAACKTKPCVLAQQLAKNKITKWKLIFAKHKQPTLVTYGQDSNNRLLLSLIKEFKNNINHRYQPRFVVYSGDWFCHNFNALYQDYTGDKSETGLHSFKDKTLRYLTHLFKTTFRGIPFYPSIGNNDAYVADYGVEPGGMFFKNSAKMWVNLLLLRNRAKKRRFVRQFSAAGYYKIHIRGEPQHIIIVLNSVPFSIHPITPSRTAADKAAQEELVWLERQLSRAQRVQQKVWLVFHIPIGIDAYKTITTNKAGKKITPYPFWLPRYTTDFLRILKRFPAIIEGIFVAHTHMDAFSVVQYNGKNSVIYEEYTPGISPIFDNNPGFKIYRYNDKTFEVLNFCTYMFEPKTGRWQREYNFKKVYFKKPRHSS